MATPAELELMCKIDSISSTDLSALAQKMKPSLPGGELPPSLVARICWRALINESTKKLTALDDDVICFLNLLDDLAATGVVEKPATALLLGVRTEYCVRHLREAVDLPAFKAALAKFFPASKDYDAPGSRLERSRRNVLLEACSGTPAAVQSALNLCRPEDTLDQLADYLDMVDTRLGTPKNLQVARKSVRPTSPADLWGAIADLSDDDFPAAPYGQPATQAPPGHAATSPVAQYRPPAQRPSPPTAAAAAKGTSPAAKPLQFTAASPKAAPKAVPLSPPVDESARAQMTWPRVSLAALRRACPDDDFDALRERPITAAEAAARARERSDAAAAAAAAAAAKAVPKRQRKDDASEDEAPAGRGRGATKKAARPQKRSIQQLLLDDDEDEDFPAPMQVEERAGAEAGTQQGIPGGAGAAAAAVAVPAERRSPLQRMMEAVVAPFRRARGVLKETGEDPLAATLLEAAHAMGGAGAASPPPGQQLRIDPLGRGPTAKTVGWSEEKELPARRSGSASDGDPDYLHLDRADLDDITEDDSDTDDRPKKKQRRADPAARRAPATTASGRRVAVRWTDAEVALLIRLHATVPAVKKFQPWAYILRAGGDGFQAGRSSVDIKDKWRNLVKAGTVA